MPMPEFSLMQACTRFLEEQGLIRQGEEFFSSTPHAEAPSFIAAWIMQNCDELLLNGLLKPPDVVRGTYNHAQKMRAAMTYRFGRLHGLGMLPWHKSEITEKWIGNPSISVIISTYMVSLHRRKVCAGETTTSARAITSDIMLKMYDFNRSSEHWQIKDYAPIPRKSNPRDLHEWGRGRARRLLFAAYTIAFLCLLRFDEALKIQAHDIEQESENCIKITLPFRKTSQYGDIKPFYLYALPKEMAHLCPVRALSEWLFVSQINEGYIFCRIMSGDRVAVANTPMSTEQFLEMFRNNLLDVGIDPHPYGTHSFRRGGCQYLSVELRWPLRKICEWGGWSQEFTHLTIAKYLISWNDDEMTPRKDFFNTDLLGDGRVISHQNPLTVFHIHKGGVKISTVLVSRPLTDLLILGLAQLTKVNGDGSEGHVLAIL
ncbi:hypothetical protein EW146_g10421 [Bondarzewia mesenterica]|uniref:Tyr recombinase domain-containing protein n=1 Tax=Bondarzewia mesenterica TaxID=1095465 RepID=A0A4S4KXL5_9AGAM|nr:hypothetical protein EW146_g10421 [Bondarzewia mesenterica]